MKICAGKIMAILLLLDFSNSKLEAQTVVTNSIRPHSIETSYNKTTNLIFPYVIKSVDRGSSDILVQKAKGVDNILQLKAGKKDFEQTNLSIVTADGKFYSFIVSFAPSPANLNICFNSESTALLNKQTSEELLTKESFQVQAQYPFLGIRKEELSLQLALQGIYLSSNSMWFKLHITNCSQIDFAPDYVRFFLRDKHRSKRTAIQETEVFPVYNGSTEAVKGTNASVWTMAFTPFTIPTHQHLIIQVGDKTGGRSIELRVKSKNVLRAKKLQ